MDEKLREAYWAGYDAGSEFHQGSGYRADNPYDSRAVEPSEEEEALAQKWEEGFADAGADS